MRKPAKRKAPLRDPLLLDSLSDLPPVLTFFVRLLLLPECRTMAGELRERWLALCDRVRTAVAWQDRRVLPEAALAFFAFSEEWPTWVTILVHIAPPPLSGGELLVLFALVGEKDFAAARAELVRACVRLHATEELGRRMEKHPIGTLLFAATAIQARDFARSEWPAAVREGLKQIEDFAADQWVRRAQRTVPLDNVRRVTAESDWEVALQERQGLVGQRLAEELQSLRRKGLEQLAAATAAGSLNFHRVAARQAVRRGERPERERHIPAADPHDAAKASRRPAVRFHTEPEDKQQRRAEKGKAIDAHEVARIWGWPKETDPAQEAEAAAENKELAAADRVIRAGRLPKKKALVVRYIANTPGAEALPSAILASQISVNVGIDVSPETVKATKATIRQWAGDKATLLRILYPE